MSLARRASRGSCRSAALGVAFRGLLRSSIEFWGALRPREQRDPHGSDGTSASARTLRPCTRARLLWLRIRRRHPGPPFARHRGEVARGAAQPRAPRRHRRREEHRRRRRHPLADAARLLRPGVPEARDQAAGPWPLWGGHGLPPAQRDRAGGHQRPLRGDRARGGAGAARLARGAHRRRRARPHRQGEPADHPPGLHRTWRGRRGRGRLRAQAVRDPQAAGEEGFALRHPGPQLLLRQQPEPQDHRLQGNVQRRPAAPLLSRPGRPVGRLGDRDGPPALLHQHLPLLGAGPPLPLHLAQRGDQHPARQHQLDACAPGDDALEALRQGSDEDPHRGRHHRLRLGDVRQRPRAAHAGRPRAAARDDDDGARALVARRHHGTRAEGLLRVPLLPDGALGRARLHRLHRRDPRRRGPRSQRPAACALLRDEGRPGGDGLRGGRPRHPAGGRGAQGPAAAGPPLPGGYRPAAHRRRRRAEGPLRARSALRRVAAQVDAADGEPPPAEPAAAAGARGPGPPAASVRLHLRGGEAPDRAHGHHCQRGGGVDGHRHAAGRPLRTPPPAVRLLQAALRAGDQPARRRHPRRDHHGLRHHHRAGGEPARARAGILPAAGAVLPHPHQRRAGEDPLAGRRPCVQRAAGGQASDLVQPQGRRRRSAQRPGGPALEGLGVPGGGIQRHRPFRPRS